MSLIRRRMLWLSAAAASLFAAGAAAQGTGTPDPRPTAPAARATASDLAANTGATRRLRLYRLAPGRRDGRHQVQGLVRDAQLRHRTRRGARRNTGHHHLLIDVPVPPLDQPIPNDHNHLHFGLGQTETMIELPPGTHTLQLLMGDADHVPHDPPVMSRRITIYVRPETPVPEVQLPAPPLQSRSRATLKPFSR